MRRPANMTDMPLRQQAATQRASAICPPWTPDERKRFTWRIWSDAVNGVTMALPAKCPG
jgi:hypothetical protein